MKRVTYVVKYIPGPDNPADYPSRNELKQHQMT